MSCQKKCPYCSEPCPWDHCAWKQDDTESEQKKDPEQESPTEE